MDSKAYARAVRVGGEVIVLRCWACGTEHCVSVEQCAPEEFAYMICSRRDCGMSMFLVNELVFGDQTRKQMTKSELNARATYSRFWK
jgi:hypothetical protein